MLPASRTHRFVPFVLFIMAVLWIVSTVVTIAAFPSENAVSSSIVHERAPIRVMTYNIRHAEGMDGKINPAALLQQIKNAGADVIALQEVDRWKLRSGIKDQAEYFAKELGMHYIYAPAIQQGLSQYGIELLSRFPFEASEQYLLTGGREPRSVLTAVVNLNGESVTIATTHLGVSEADRKKQLPQLFSILQSIHRPLILMGDFNTSASNPLLHDLTGQLGLQKIDLAAPSSTVAAGGEIDHIFISEGVRSESYASVGGGYISDHLPVFASLREMNIAEN